MSSQRDPMRLTTRAGRDAAVLIACVAASHGALPASAQIPGTNTPVADMDAGTGQSPRAVQRFATDETLRKGMAAIRLLVLNHHTLITHRRMPPAGAVRFAAEMKTQADTIRANTRTAPEAAEHLRSLLTSMIEGAEAIAGRNPDLTPLDGLMRIDGALASYAAGFDDPDWRPLR